MITALIGPAGSGKTTMMCLTAPRRPIHVVDIDRKISAMDNLRTTITKGDLTFWELNDGLTEDKLGARIRTLMESTPSTRPPRGWTLFADYCDKLESDESFKKCGTLGIDSYTLLSMHLKAHMQFISGKSKLIWDAWAAWGQMWREVTTALIDIAKKYDKDLIVTLHERTSEIPGEKTKNVIIKRDEKGQQQRDYVGQMDIKIAGSIEGAFGLQFGAYFTDVYALSADVDEKGQPKWVCRVHPDGRRDLRCSFNTIRNGVLQTDFPPNFATIMGVR